MDDEFSCYLSAKTLTKYLRDKKLMKDENDEVRSHIRKASFSKWSRASKTNMEAKFLKHEVIFYRALSSWITPGYVSIPMVIDSSYFEMTELVMNGMIMEDVSSEVDKPIFVDHQLRWDIEVMSLVKSLAEFHSYSIGMSLDSRKMPWMTQCTDKWYVDWVNTKMRSIELITKWVTQHKSVFDTAQIHFFKRIDTTLVTSLIRDHLHPLLSKLNMRCLIHGDSFISNFMIPKEITNGKLSKQSPFAEHISDLIKNRCLLIDWQTYLIGSPMFDLVSLFDGLIIEPGSKEECHLFCAYLDFLKRFGAKTYITAETMKDYVKQFEICRIIAFVVESGLWSHYILVEDADNEGEYGVITKKAQAYLQKRVNHMQKCFQLL
ncbi:hypothetical protein RFI_03755 [Reticulomyxa filosa]|uniref:CHK kinase-like domain-containing protein n=1 Tax=Reticulomyxa filosa TaxID=46433 RepID=X6P5G2_RETFI|nr:hypothetical protein RFI_03755 [Reticulomyxa filosa]|eukprot:ETO33353.1 hypothetical protein RFI_03755 [Reticulomyxa filosa]